MESLYQRGWRLAKEGHGVSDLWGNCSKDSEMDEMLRGMEAYWRGQAAPVPPAGDVEVVARVIATGGPHDTEDRVLCEQVAELPSVGTELVDRAHVTRLTAERDGLLAELKAMGERYQKDLLLSRERWCYGNRADTKIAELQSALTKAQELLQDLVSHPSLSFHQIALVEAILSTVKGKSDDKVSSTSSDGDSGSHPLIADSGLLDALKSDLTKARELLENLCDTAYIQSSEGADAYDEARRYLARLQEQCGRLDYDFATVSADLCEMTAERDRSQARADHHWKGLIDMRDERDKLLAEVERLAPLAYIGEHQHEDYTYKYRLKELQSELTKALGYIKEIQTQHRGKLGFLHGELQNFLIAHQPAPAPKGEQ